MSTHIFVKQLDVDETLALLLVAEGFRNIEEVAYVAPEEFAGIEGFDADLVAELQNRARESLERLSKESEKARVALGVSDEIAAIEGLTTAMMVTLGEAGIKTLDDLGDLAADELTSREDGILRTAGLSEEQANEIIMAARAHWFEDEEVEEATEEAAEDVVEKTAEATEDSADVD
ncbi:MAG: hypothetical protein JKY59_06665 [Emcibacter sp.]|nr:hypothetical protein [Emcibacter sp.]